MLFGILSLSYFAVQFADEAVFVAAVEEYFVCEAAGSGMECDRSGFEKFTHIGLVKVIYIMLGLFPVINLTFVFNWTFARATVKHTWMRCSQLLVMNLLRVTA